MLQVLGLPGHDAVERKADGFQELTSFYEPIRTHHVNQYIFRVITFRSDISSALK
jgi:hypothetical protein